MIKTLSNFFFRTVSTAPVAEKQESSEPIQTFDPKFESFVEPSPTKSEPSNKEVTEPE